MATEPTAVPPIDLDNIILYGATNHQDDNVSSPQGGAVDCSRKMAIGGVARTLPITIVSNNPGDTSQIYVVEGLSSVRVVERETITLTGNIPTTTEQTFSRFYRITKQSGNPLLGTVTVSAGTDVLGTMNIESGMEVTEVRAFLANAIGRATVDSAFYEKFFIKNLTGETIDQLILKEHQSDFKERVLFGADPTFDNASTSRNRLTKPGSVNPGDFLTDGNLVFTNIPHGTSVGIWLRLLIPAGEGTVLNSWKLKLFADGEEVIYTLLHPEGSGEALSETIRRRDLHPIGGGNPIQFIELEGGKMVQQIYYEPDPTTFRDQFYYNARLNLLFKKLNTKPVPVWKIVR